jgi:hypothetical protein
MLSLDHEAWHRTCSWNMNPEQFLQRWTDGNINQQPKILTA